MRMRMILNAIGTLALVAAPASAAPGNNDGHAKEASRGNDHGASPSKNKPDPGGEGQRQVFQKRETSEQTKVPAAASKPHEYSARKDDRTVSTQLHSQRGNDAGFTKHAGQRSAHDAKTAEFDRSWMQRKSLGLINGCPPGLSKKDNHCQAPGLAKARDRRLYSPYANPAWWRLSLGSGDFFYSNGYLLRLGSNGLVTSYSPLLGGALAIGNRWPSPYEPVVLPPYYVGYYALGRADSYRYHDHVIYRIDPETAAITSIAAMLTGDEFTVGAPLPRGYSVYNVPYSYRDRYADGPDAWYRYSDGYIYEVDPQTMLIMSAIELAI